MLKTSYVPKLDRHITRLGLGCLPMGPLQRRLTPLEGAQIVKLAVENGINFIDTATLYGTYEHIASGLRGHTGTITLATKTHAKTDRLLAEKHIELALSETHRDTIDIMLCHCARNPFTMEEWGPTLEALITARQKGDIRLIGVSSHSIANVHLAAKHPEIDVIHPLINYKGMGITDGSKENMLAAIKEAAAAGKFIYAMKALAGGNFIPDRENALNFIFDVEEIGAVVVGMVTPQEVEWNVRFASGLEISAELQQQTALASKRLDIVDLACVGCGECIEFCENNALSVVNGKALVDHEHCILCGYCAPHCQTLAIRMV